jgi:hypothetical protein
LQPILRSLGQFLLTKINLFRKFNCKRNLLKLVRIPINENILSFSIWDPTIHEHIHNQGTFFLTRD